ncbi:MAG: AAA family ATPase [Gammaproteobacteria bacterium]|nr:AAA family ATPase [Gammaproteobacteria bacterium]
MEDSVLKAGNRGSVWRRWEPHIHTPGTVLEDRFPKENGWELYLDALEAVSPRIRAIGVTDYCITRSYERMREEKEKGRLKECELLFPNVELRLKVGTVKGNFVNIHLLVSPEDPRHVEELNRFLGRLSFAAFDDEFTCTPSELARLGRRFAGEELDEEAALKQGVMQFKVSLDNLLETYRNIEWAQANIVIAVAGTADGTSGVKDAADATLRQEIDKAAHVILASSLKQRDYWLGNGAASLTELQERYGGPKPCIWGSDAHDLKRVGKPAEDRFCWLKGLAAFDTLRQAYRVPERAYVGSAPPSWMAGSQVIDQVRIENAPWIKTPVLDLNAGLTAVIGGRGSGKTALVDAIAAGCGSYEESEGNPSFLARAKEHLSGSQVVVKWRSGEASHGRALDAPGDRSSDAHPRARYLSQQFVEDLCSVEGMPKLIAEIERVIFEAHPSLEREGAFDFGELLERRAGGHRDTRSLEESALANVSDQIGIEMEKAREVNQLQAKIDEKEKLVARYEKDRNALLPKGDKKTSEWLQELVAAAEKVRGYLRALGNRRASIVRVENEIRDLRQNRAPEGLRVMKENYKNLGFNEAEWERFLLEYVGDVDGVVTAKSKEVEKSTNEWKGKKPAAALDGSGAFLAKGSDLARTPLAVLEAEIERVEQLVAADRESARKVAAVSKRIAEERNAIASLRERHADCKGARGRAEMLVGEREEGYIRVFDALLAEEGVLNELYAPLVRRLTEAGGTLGKLSFSVTRVADVRTWAKQGEDELFDLRGGPFKGIGSLEKEANNMLRDAWRTGDSKTVSEAMAAFRDKHQDALLEKAPYPRSDRKKYRPWSRRFAQWLYSTNHISLEYGIRYDGIELEKLSPGTRGVVLVLLYLALDDGDDRPLIIDQPEENLDPKSIYDELVPLFEEAKKKRQVIMVTHNANLVVNTDADQIVVAHAGPQPVEGLPAFTYRSGGLDEEDIRKVVCDILEGGERAFRDRARRLRISLER